MDEQMREKFEKDGYVLAAYGIRASNTGRITSYVPLHDPDGEVACHNPVFVVPLYARADECTEPNRAECPRLCQDFCNKTEELRAAVLSQPAAADEVKAELVVAAKRALNVLKGMGNTPNPKNALGALEAAIAKATL